MLREYEKQEDWLDQPLARVDAGGTAWYHQDVRGSVVALTDGNGTVQTQYAYDGFGNATVSGSTAFADGIRYTARFFDNLTGLQHNRARWYDPKTGRWISEDPMGFGAGDANLYRYAGNGQTNASDPSGYQPPSQLIPSDRFIPVITQPTEAEERSARNYYIKLIAAMLETLAAQQQREHTFRQRWEKAFGANSLVQLLERLPTHVLGRLEMLLVHIDAQSLRVIKAPQSEACYESALLELMQQDYVNMVQLALVEARLALNLDNALARSLDAIKAANDRSAVRDAQQFALAILSLFDGIGVPALIADIAATVQRSQSSEALWASLPFLLWKRRIFWAHKHHIATNKHRDWTPQFRPLFDNAGLSMNDWHNIAIVVRHVGPHPPEYHRLILRSLVQAVGAAAPGSDEYRARLIARLAFLRKECEDPNSPINRWITAR